MSDAAKPSLTRMPEMDQPGRTRCAILLAIAAGLIALQAAALLAMGHPAICTCGRIDLWHGNPSGPETSQHLTDWYTYTHVVHGFGFYLLLWLIAPRMPFLWRLVIAIGLEAGWEVIENTPFIMDRYRQSALARGYFGDSVVNSVVDTLAAALGFTLARVLPVWVSVAFVVGLELFAAYMIRDNLILNIIQLIHPSEVISRWQTGG
jgi:hypothetical protein